MFGCDTISDTGAKSFNASNGSLGIKAGLTVWVVVMSSSEKKIGRPTCSHAPTMTRVRSLPGGAAARRTCAFGPQAQREEDGEDRPFVPDGELD